MKKSQYLTSIVVLSFAMPAFADFPADGLMQENQIYTGAAIYANLGAYEGTVYANAQYADAAYNLLPGTYLPAGETAVADCISGYYCPGSDTAVTYSDSAQGLTQCPNGYNSSDSEASSAGQCYRTCSSAAHAASMTGNDYYGFSADTCEVATCVAGWHVKPRSDDNTAFQMYLVSNNTGTALNSGYITDGGVFYNSFNSDQYYSQINNSNSENSGSSYENSAVANSNISTLSSASFYNMENVGEWAVGYGYYHGFVRGTARLASVDNAVVATASTPPTVRTTAQLGNGSGTGCYCNITGYAPWTGGPSSPLSETSWKIATSSWAYVGGSYSSLGSCAYSCAAYMAQGDAASLSFRFALFQTVMAYEPAKCVANTITINWNGTSAAEINANQAGSAYYGGDVRTPRSATPVPGKIFQGWMFSATPPTE